MRSKRQNKEPLSNEVKVNRFAKWRYFTFCALLILLPTILLWSVTFGGRTLVPADLLMVMSPWRHFSAQRFPEFDRVKAPLLDVIQQYYPWRKFYAETVRKGQLPLWNPYMFCGTSFVGNGMSAVFYPPNLSFLAMPIYAAFGWCAWLHLVLAGIFMFGFLQRFVSPIPALAGAITFQLCGFFIAWLAYLPLLCTAIWLPAALWAYEYGCKHPLLPVKSLSSVALGMALISGHPQIAFYVLWSFAVYVIIHSVVAKSFGQFTFGIIALLLGIALGSTQLLPSLEMAKLSQRVWAVSFSSDTANRLPFDQFIRLFVPTFFGDWRSGAHFFWDFAKFNFVEKTGYPSIVSFLIAVCGLTILTEKQIRSPLFVSGVVFSAIGLLSASIPIVHRFMAMGLPVTQAFTGISRALFLFDFGIAMLCAFGMERIVDVAFQLSDDKTVKSRLLVMSLGLTLIVMASCVSYGVIVHGHMAFHPILKHHTTAQIYRWLIFTAIGVTAIISMTSVVTKKLFKGKLGAILAGSFPFLIAVDLLSFAYGQNPEADKRMVFFQTRSLSWLQQHIRSNRIVSVGTDAIKNWMPSNTSMVYGLRDAQGSDSIMTMRIYRFLQTWDKRSPLHQAFAVRNFSSPMIDLMSVKFVVSAKPLSISERNGLRLVHADDLWVYENPDALPRALLVSQFQFASSPQDALKTVSARHFDPHKIVVLEAHGKIFGKQLQKDLQAIRSSKRYALKAGVILQLKDEVNRLSLDVRLSQPGFLMLADSYYPGWKAFQMSYGKLKQLPVLTANYSFRAVALPKGKHKIWWVYFPSSIAIGIFLSLIAWLVLCAISLTRTSRQNLVR